jgi:hypothetical protein
MVLDIPVRKFIGMMEHDGSKEPYESLPGQKAGFHEQECIEVLQRLGYACTPIEIVPQMMPVSGGPIRPIWFLPEQVTDSQEDGNWQRWVNHLEGTHGVITGVKRFLEVNKVLGHAVAWNREVYDPQGRGFIYSLEKFNDYGFVPRVYWKIQEIIDGRAAKNGSLNTCTGATEKV